MQGTSQFFPFSASTRVFLSIVSCAPAFVLNLPVWLKLLSVDLGTKPFEANLQSAVPEGLKGPAALLHSVAWSNGSLQPLHQHGPQVSVRFWFKLKVNTARLCKLPQVAFPKVSQETQKYL